MKKWRFMLLAVGTLLVLSLVFALTRSREPVYQGAPLSLWLDRLESSDSKDRAEARDALRAMGSNAVPFLIAMIGEKDSKLKATFSARQSIIKYSYRPPSSRLFVVVEALGLARHRNARAEPALIELLDRPDRALAAVNGLMALGVEDKTVYERALLNPDTTVRHTAATALTRIAEEKPMRASIGEYMQLPAPGGAMTPTRVRTFGSSRADILPSAVVPVLVERATNSSPRIRLAAVLALADFGRMYPSKSEPALKAALTDSDDAVRRAATNALSKVARPR